MITRSSNSFKNFQKINPYYVTRPIADYIKNFVCLNNVQTKLLALFTL